ncbi:MAG: hypothetical protein R2716_04855 [Microthrixaceae bacterium]
MLKAHHEPFPLIVVDDAYGVVDLNHAAWRLLGALLGLSASGSPPTPAQLAELDLNLARLTFDPAGAQPHLANFDEVGRQLLWRIHREVLADPGNDELRELLEDLLEMPTVSPRWREVDLGVRSDPALVLHLRSDDLELRFLTTVTAFQAPQNVAWRSCASSTGSPTTTRPPPSAGHSPQGFAAPILHQEERDD